MNVISVSFKSAPLAVRALFAFSKEEQSDFFKKLFKLFIATACDILSCDDLRTYLIFTKKELCMQVLYSLCNNSFSICLYKIAILDYIGKKQLARAYHTQNSPLGLNHCFAAVLLMKRRSFLAQHSEKTCKHVLF